MSRVDKIIDLIDVGLQTPMPDPTYGEVSPVNRESCFRCNRPPEDGSDMCAGCRSFMLGDSEDDPAHPKVVVRTAVDLSAFVETVERVSEVVASPRMTHISLHTTAPTDAATAEVATAGYARQSINWTTMRFEFRPTPPETE